MVYYSIQTLSEAYSLSYDCIKYRIKRGQLKAIKLILSATLPKQFKYVVPENELHKIAKFKLHNPVVIENDQPDYWEEYVRLELEKREKQRAEREAREEERRRDNPAYYGYIKSEVWCEKRLQRLKLDGFQCQRCGIAKNLRVHHITYEHFGHEPMEDLITLCDNCHRKIHEKDLSKDI